MTDGGGVNVIHLVGEDTPPGRLAALRLLLTESVAGGLQRVMIHGRRLPRLTNLGAERRDRFPFSLDTTAQCTILHIWSLNALGCDVYAECAWRAADSEPLRVRILIDIEFPADPVRRFHSIAPIEAPFACIVPSAAMASRVHRAGVPPERCTVVPDAVDFGRLRDLDRRLERERLDIAEQAQAICLIPPISRDSGALIGAWAAMIVQRVRSDVVVILPGEGREHDRIERLFDSVGRRGVLRRTHDDTDLAPAIIAADVCLFLPERENSLSGVAWAMAARRPLVLSAIPCITELFAHDLNARLALPGNPRSAAQRLLQTLESPLESQRLAAAAHAQAYQTFGKQRMLEQYRAVYRTLISSPDLATIESNLPG